jgi:hypothetical protein
MILILRVLFQSILTDGESILTGRRAVSREDPTFDPTI